MHVVIGSVSLAPFEHTAHVSIKRKTDETGLDTLWNEVTASVICVWSPFAVGSLTGPVAPATADRLGVTASNLRTNLMRPRQQVTIDLGPDRAFTAPLNDPNNLEGGALPCDPMGGPFVDADVLEIHGDKSAIVKVTIRLAYNDDTHFVVSNRWTVTSQTDAESWLTVRTIHGRAVLRMDYLSTIDPDVVPDQFRRSFVMLPPAGFMRRSVNVVATPNGQELMYTVVDKQMRLNLGVDSMITNLEGDVTAGYDWPFKQLPGFMALAGEGALLFASDAVGQAFVTKAVGVWSALMATAKARVVCRVTGRQGADYTNLSAFAIQCCLDRLAPVIGVSGFPVSAFLTHRFDADKPMLVQAKIEYLPGTNAAYKALSDPKNNLAILMNLAENLPIATTNPLRGNPSLPGSNNTRGTWVSMMVSQVLATSGTPVGLPPLDALPARRDVGGLP